MRLLATGVPAHEDIAPAYYAAVNTVLSLRPFPSQTPGEDYTLDVIDSVANSDGSDDGEQPLPQHSGPVVQPSDATLDEATIASAARSSSNDAIQPSNATSDALTIPSASESTTDAVTQPPSSSNIWDGNFDLASFLGSGNSSNLLNGASPFPFQQQTPQPIPSTWFITYVPYVPKHGEPNHAVLVRLFSKHPRGFGYRRIRAMLAAMAAGELDPVLKAESDFYVEYFSGHRGAERIIEDASRYIHFFIRKAYRNETDYYHQLYLINPQLPFCQTPQPGFSWSPTNGVMAVIPTN